MYFSCCQSLCATLRKNSRWILVRWLLEVLGTVRDIHSLPYAWQSSSSSSTYLCMWSEPVARTEPSNRTAVDVDLHQLRKSATPSSDQLEAVARARNSLERHDQVDHAADLANFREELRRFELERRTGLLPGTMSLAPPSAATSVVPGLGPASPPAAAAWPGQEEAPASSSRSPKTDRFHGEASTPRQVAGRPAQTSGNVASDARREVFPNPSPPPLPPPLAAVACNMKLGNSAQHAMPRAWSAWWPMSPGSPPVSARTLHEESVTRSPRRSEVQALQQEAAEARVAAHQAAEQLHHVEAQATKDRNVARLEGIQLYHVEAQAAEARAAECQKQDLLRYAEGEAAEARSAAHKAANQLRHAELEAASLRSEVAEQSEELWLTRQLCQDLAQEMHEAKREAETARNGYEETEHNLHATQQAAEELSFNSGAQATKAAKAARDVLAAGAKLQRIQQAQHALASSGGIAASTGSCPQTVTSRAPPGAGKPQRVLYAIPPRRPSDESAARLLAEMAAGLRTLEAAAGAYEHRDCG
eukprot:TRINITY_DN29701_c0_g1_i1.p1 TRINITY_DN29701_c0_g1~~TRINITY_DN29701_c0_g1_i1.p1  ORF type:complete len:531 (-),score=102.93 TRINITY_DN29701_c0_g1_i1:21-1613(-)